MAPLSALLATGAVALVSLPADPAAAQAKPTQPAKTVRTYVAYVDGMACPLCAFGVRKQLAKLPGVLSVKADLARKLFRIRVRPGGSLDEAAVRARVREAGFTLRRLVVDGTGS